MRPRRIFEPWQKDFLAENASKKTIKELSEKLNIPPASINKYCENNGLLTKNAHSKKRKELSQQIVKTERPPSDYNQIPSPFGIATTFR